MATHQDHDRQDAHHAIRLELAKQFGRYMRRARQRAYAIIEEEATNHDGTDRVIDWSSLGSAAANQAIADVAGVTAGSSAVGHGDVVTALASGAAPDDE